jgi:hypothetical protein
VVLFGDFHWHADLGKVAPGITITQRRRYEAPCETFASGGTGGVEELPSAYCMTMARNSKKSLIGRARTRSDESSHPFSTPSGLANGQVDSRVQVYVIHEWRDHLYFGFRVTKRTTASMAPM